MTFPTSVFYDTAASPSTALSLTGVASISKEAEAQASPVTMTNSPARPPQYGGRNDDVTGSQPLRSSLALQEEFIEREDSVSRNVPRVGLEGRVLDAPLANSVANSSFSQKAASLRLALALPSSFSRRLPEILKPRWYKPSATVSTAFSSPNRLRSSRRRSGPDENRFRPSPHRPRAA